MPVYFLNLSVFCWLGLTEPYENYVSTTSGVQLHITQESQASVTIRTLSLDEVDVAGAVREWLQSKGHQNKFDVLLKVVDRYHKSAE